MDAAADIFLAPFSQQPQNAAAQRFDQLAADLGFMPNSANGLLRVDTEAEQAYREIEGTLDTFLRSQLASPSPASTSVPPQLTRYLKEYEASLAAVQTHLLERETPLWEIDFEQMAEASYPLPGFVNVLGVQKLLLLSAIDHQQHRRTEQMEQALEVSWRLNQAIATRPDLVSQLLVSLTAEKQAGILRHIDAMPPEFYETWQSRLGTQSQHSMTAITRGLQFDAWLQYKVLQNSLSRMTGGFSKTSPGAVSGLSASGGLASTLSYWFSPAYYFSLSNLDTNETSQSALEHLSELDLCQTTQLAAEQQLASRKTAVWNKAVLPSKTLARRWKEAGDRALALELTQKVLLARQGSQSGRWPTTIPNLHSEICPKEAWVYEVKSDKTVTLSFSTQRSSKAVVPLTYRTNRLAAD